jgi:hypothetical protein
MAPAAGWQGVTVEKFDLQKMAGWGLLRHVIGLWPEA